jgi:preprotein translocase subunit SecG
MARHATDCVEWAPTQRIADAHSVTPNPLPILLQLDPTSSLVYNFISRRQELRCWCLIWWRVFTEVFVATFALILQAANALLLVILMALQTEKAEQGGGVMGLGAAGGRQSGSVDMMVGPERILKPLTRWSAIGLLFSSIFAAAKDPSIPLFLGLLAVYVALMLFGNQIWRAVIGVNR